MVCVHLQALETDLKAHGVEETYRGQAWSKNCHEWVYFVRHLDLAALRARFDLAPCVTDHMHRGTHNGAEAGFVCNEHWDAIMGAHPDIAPHLPAFR